MLKTQTAFVMFQINKIILLPMHFTGIHGVYKSPVATLKPLAMTTHFWLWWFEKQCDKSNQYTKPNVYFYHAVIRNTAFLLLWKKKSRKTIGQKACVIHSQ